MYFQDEITRAITAHAMWKTRLLAAIDSGMTEIKPVNAAKDNLCEFGQWLYGATVPAAARGSADYEIVRGLHADFHKCAARVLQYVVGGQTAQAKALMASEYARISDDLTAAMTKWRGLVR